MKNLLTIILLISTCYSFGQAIKKPRNYFIGLKYNNKRQTSVTGNNYQSYGARLSVEAPIAKHIALEFDIDLFQSVSLEPTGVTKQIVGSKVTSPTLYVMFQPTTYNKSLFNPYVGLGYGLYNVTIDPYKTRNTNESESTLNNSTICFKSGLNFKASPKLMLNTGFEVLSLSNTSKEISTNSLLMTSLGLLIKI